MTQATASMTTFQTMREDIDEWDAQEETRSLKNEPTGKHKKQGPPQTIKCPVDVEVAKQGETGKAGSIRTIGTEFEDESSYVDSKLPYNNVRRGWVVKPGEWSEPNSGKEDYIMVGSEGPTSRSQSRKVMIILTLTCILFTAAFVPVCIIILRGTRRSADPGNETDTPDPEPDLSDPHVISQSYVHIYNGTSIENMDVVQMQEFETLLEGYTKYYVRAGGSGTPGWVTTTCKIKEQTLYNKKKRKVNEQRPPRDDDDDDNGLKVNEQRPARDGDDDDNGLSRNLFQEVHRDRFDEKYLEVGFTMIYASSVTNVLEEDYPTNFYKFMNSDTGKATLLENMKNIGIRVEAIDNLRLRDVPSGKITDPPTSFPTIPIPSHTPSKIPTFNPTTTHPTPSPTRRPTSQPTRRPTNHPTS